MMCLYSQLEVSSVSGYMTLGKSFSLSFLIWKMKIKVCTSTGLF